jgi:uncharacterized membrane protein
VAYEVCKLLHLLGVVFLLGNVVITSVWKVFADRTGDARIIGHAQRLVTITDFVFTLGGILLMAGGGYGAAHLVGLDPFGVRWLVEGQILFVVSGAMWLFVLVPLQIRQARLARGFAAGGEIPAQYRRDARRWIFWGVLATLPLVAATWTMIRR